MTLLNLLVLESFFPFLSLFFWFLGIFYIDDRVICKYRKFHFLLQENKVSQLPRRTLWRVCEIPKIELPQGPAIPHLGQCPKELWADRGTDIWTPVITAVCSQQPKRGHGPRARQHSHGQNAVHTHGEVLLTLKKEGDSDTLWHGWTLKITMPSEISQLWKDKTLLDFMYMSMHRNRENGGC